MWIICALLTFTDYFPAGHPARTDIKLRIIDDSPWFRVPYPGNHFNNIIIGNMCYLI